MNSGSNSCREGETPGNYGDLEMIYSGPVTGSVCPFFDQVFGGMSTMLKNLVLIDYFVKLTDLRAILTD